LPQEAKNPQEGNASFSAKGEGWKLEAVWQVNVKNAEWNQYSPET